MSALFCFTPVVLWRGCTAVVLFATCSVRPLAGDAPVGSLHRRCSSKRHRAHARIHHTHIHTRARAQALAIARQEPNFASFIGKGTQHVVTQDDGMYDRADGSVKFVDWLTAIVEGTPVQQNVDCAPHCE